MAALKKPMRRKDAAKPSTVLIIFLVFFILISIGLGVATYYGYAEQNALRKGAAEAMLKVDVNGKLDDIQMGKIYLLANAIGHDIGDVAAPRAAAALKDLVNDPTKYTDADRKNWVDLHADLAKELVYDDATQKFKENFRAKYNAAAKDLKDALTQLAKTQQAYKDEQAKYAKYEDRSETLAKDGAAQIKKGNDAAYAAAIAKFESFNELVKLNKEIQDQKIDADVKLKDALDKLGTEKARFDKLLDSLEKKNEGQTVVQTKRSGDQHALILDLSRGIPLWDRPVGKITRVDLERRQVYINLGSALGVRPELTFSIFADDGRGNAEKFLKGTLEVIRVIDGQSSLCRLTSLYDARGVEIALNDPTGGRAAREVEAAIRDGDLLFNMFWNTRVAVAGAVNFTGFPIDAPSEQMRQMEMFTQLLARMSIHTDAILDLNDGQMKGALSNKTRFLVLGDLAFPKDPKDEAQKDRAKLINDGIEAMKTEAVEKGLFLISAENFTIAAGYRKPRNANVTELGKFGARVPLAGVSDAGGLVIQREAPGGAAPMPMPKKEEDKKLPDAKEKEGK